MDFLPPWVCVRKGFLLAFILQTFSGLLYWFLYLISQSLTICFLILVQTELSEKSLFFPIATRIQLFYHADLGLSKVVLIGHLIVFGLFNLAFVYTFIHAIYNNQFVYSFSST